MSEQDTQVPWDDTKSNQTIGMLDAPRGVHKYIVQGISPVVRKFQISWVFCVNSFNTEKFSWFPNQLPQKVHGKPQTLTEGKKNKKKEAVSET